MKHHRRHHRHSHRNYSTILTMISVVLAVIFIAFIWYMDSESNKKIEVNNKILAEQDKEPEAEENITPKLTETPAAIENTENDKIKIVWFGTSIPAGDGENSYPALVNKIIGDNVEIYNEAVGSSCVRAGSWEYITDEDPLGYSGMFAGVLLRSFSLSSAEKQAIFDNWECWRDKLKEAPVVLSDSDKELYLNCSWDNKLTKYLGENKADIYVFDHGHNDSINYNWNDDSELGLIPEDSYDRTYFIGAMNFLVQKIYEDNPNAKIILIGHYENDRKAGISQAQIKLSEYLKLPLEKTWESTKWTQDVIETTGYWEDGYWVESGGDNQELTVTQMWMSDDLHPHSDKSGKACSYLAQIHAKYLKEILNLE